MIVTYIYPCYPIEQIRVQLRCRNLADAINRTGLHKANLLDWEAFVHNTPEAQQLCGEADLLVIYRYLYGASLELVEYWKARDKKVIVDFDLALQALTPAMPFYAFWHQGLPLGECGRDKFAKLRIDPSPLEQFKWGLGLVDAATVASARLADDWSRFTEVYELPDYLNIHHYPALNQFHEGEIWIGIGYGATDDSVRESGLQSALENVCRARPQVRLVTCVSGRKSEKLFHIRPAQLQVHPVDSFDEWVQLLLQLDLGLAPYFGEFDLRRGPIDLLEFMVAKVPWIASEQLTFCELTNYGQWTKNSSASWEAAILEAVDQLAQYRRSAAREPFLFALQQDVSTNLEKVLKIYAAILKRASN